jgi:hypothetical protein
MKRTITLIALVLLFSLMIQADICIKQKTNTPAMMGQPAKAETVEQWLGDGKMAMVGGPTGFVVDLVAKKILIIDNNEKTYVETSLPLDFGKLLPKEIAPMMEQVMSGMTVSVEKVGTAKKVAGFDTVSYKVTMNMMGMAIPMTMWVAEKLPFDWKKYYELYSQMTQIMMRGGEQLVKEMAKIQGYPLATEVDVMGMKSTTETISIDVNATAAAGTYSVPAGYKKTETLKMQ